MNKNTAKLADTIKPLLEGAAGRGLVCTYDHLKVQPEVGELIGDDRTQLYDALDAINRETCGDGYLLSAVVISDGGMPGPGFFRKLRSGEWPPLGASPVSKTPNHAVFREELARVFAKFSAPQKVAVFFDLENLTDVQDLVIAAVDHLWRETRSGKSSVYPIGFHHPGIETPTSVAHWKKEKLEQIDGLKLRPAHEQAAYGNDAADTELLGEWKSWVLDGHQSEFFPRVTLTPGDIVCLFSDDPIYHNVILKAADCRFKIWGFGDGMKGGADPRIAKYRKTFNERGLGFVDLRKMRTG